MNKNNYSEMLTKAVNPHRGSVNVKSLHPGQNIRVYSIWHGVADAVYLGPSKLKFLSAETHVLVNIKGSEHTIPNERVLNVLPQPL